MQIALLVYCKKTIHLMKYKIDHRLHIKPDGKRRMNVNRCYAHSENTASVDRRRRKFWGELDTSRNVKKEFGKELRATFKNNTEPKER